MASLPEGWESDYDGKRWFFRYKPSGIIQYTFPKPGDEFPQFVDASAPPIDLAPEERLVSQQQLKRRNTTEEQSTRAQSSRQRDAVVSATLAKGEGVGFWMQPDFLHFGAGPLQDLNDDDDDDDDDDVDDLASAGDASRDHAGPAHTRPSPGQEGFLVLASPVTSADGTPLTGSSQPAVTPEPGNLVVVPGDSSHAELPMQRSPLGIVAELPSELTAQCREETHPAPVELPTHHSMAGEPPPLVYANAFDLPPAELPATVVSAGRREQERGLDQKALFPEAQSSWSEQQQSAPVGQGHLRPPRPSKPPAQPDPHPQPEQQPPLPSMPASGPTAQRYQAYNPPRYKSPGTNANRRSQVMSYHPDTALQGDEDSGAIKRHTIADPPSSTPQPPHVPLALRPPQPPPKRPLSSFEGQNVQRNIGGRIPSVLQPARGRPILPHAETQPSGRRESAQKDYLPYTPEQQPPKESGSTSTLLSQAGHQPPLHSTSLQHSTSLRQRQPPQEPRPAVTRTNTLPTNMPDLPYMRDSPQPEASSAVPPLRVKPVELPNPLDHSRSDRILTSTETDLSAYTSQAKRNSLAAETGNAAPSPQTRASPIADAPHSEPIGHRPSAAFSILSEFGILSEPPAGPIVPPSIPPQPSEDLDNRTKGTDLGPSNSSRSRGSLDSAHAAKVESYVPTASTGPTASAAARPRHGDRRPTVSSASSFSIDSGQTFEVPIGGGTRIADRDSANPSATSIYSHNTSVVAAHRVSDKDSLSERFYSRNPATPPLQAHPPSSVHSQSPHSRAVSPSAQRAGELTGTPTDVQAHGQSPHSRNCMPITSNQSAAQPYTVGQSNAPGEVPGGLQTASSSHESSTARTREQSVSRPEATGPSQTASPVQALAGNSRPPQPTGSADQRRISLCHYHPHPAPDRSSRDSTPPHRPQMVSAAAALPPPRPQKEPIESEPRFPLRQLPSESRQDPPKTQSSRERQSLPDIGQPMPLQDRRTTPRTQSGPMVGQNIQRPGAVRKHSAPLLEQPSPASQNVMGMSRPASMVVNSTSASRGQAMSSGAHPGPQPPPVPGVVHTQVQGHMLHPTPSVTTLSNYPQQPGPGMHVGTGLASRPVMISGMPPQHPGSSQQPVMAVQPMMGPQPGMDVTQGVQARPQQPGQPSTPAQQPGQFHPVMATQPPLVNQASSQFLAPQKERSSWLAGILKGSTKKSEGASQGVTAANSRPNSPPGAYQQPNISQVFPLQSSGTPHHMLNRVTAPGTLPTMLIQQGGIVAQSKNPQQPQWVIQSQVALQPAPGLSAPTFPIQQAATQVPQQQQQQQQPQRLGPQSQPYTVVSSITGRPSGLIQAQPSTYGQQQNPLSAQQPLPPPGWRAQPTISVARPAATPASRYAQNQAGQNQAGQNQAGQNQAGQNQQVPGLAPKMSPQARDRNSWVQPPARPSVQQGQPQPWQVPLVRGMNAQQGPSQQHPPSQGRGALPLNAPVPAGSYVQRGQPESVGNVGEQTKVQQASTHHHQQILSGETPRAQESQPQPKPQPQTQTRPPAGVAAPSTSNGGGDAAVHSAGSATTGHKKVESSGARPSNGWGNTSGYDGSGWGDGDEFA